jgi:hypothetical protein
VRLGGVGGKGRVWKTPDEGYHHYVIRRRWKGYKEFMFWVAFTYDKKGPCHMWDEEASVGK